MPGIAKTPEKALDSLRKLCAKAERSTGDARRLLYRWSVEPSSHEKIILQLQKERFLDDSRYAAAFVREKLAFGGWGLRKIAAGLRAKGVSQAVADAALKEASGEGAPDMGERLRAILERKKPTVKGNSEWEVKQKLARYAVSLGYDYDTINDILDTL